MLYINRHGEVSGTEKKKKVRENYEKDDSCSGESGIDPGNALWEFGQYSAACVYCGTCVTSGIAPEYLEQNEVLDRCEH